MSRLREMPWRAAILLSSLMLGLTSCGYHASGKAVRLPSDLHTLYVPSFTNSTQTYHVETTLTQAVVRELRTRTNYRIVTSNDGTADATLNATVTYAATAPLVYDPVVGTLSSAILYVGVKVSLVNNKGKVLWSNPNFFFREQYQVSTDPASFFSEENPAMQRLAVDFSQTLVSDLLEAY